MLWCSQQLKWTVHDECGTPWESALKKQLSKSNSSLDLLFWTPTMLHISLFFLTALNVNNWRFYPCKRALKFEILLESARIIFHCCSHFFFYCFFFIFEKFQEHSSGNRRQFWSKVSECYNLVNMHLKTQTKVKIKWKSQRSILEINGDPIYRILDQFWFHTLLI